MTRILRAVSFGVLLCVGSLHAGLASAAPVTEIGIGSPYKTVYPYLHSFHSPEGTVSVVAPDPMDTQITAILTPRHGHSYQAIYEENAEHRLGTVTIIEDSPERLSFLPGSAGSRLLAHQFSLVLNQAVAADFLQAQPITHRIDAGAHETLLRGVQAGYVFSEAHSLGADHHTIYNYCVTVSSYASAKKRYTS